MFQHSGAQVVHGATGLAEAFAGQCHGAPGVPAGGHRIAALGGGLQLRDDAGQALRERVMDLRGQPAALIGDTRFPRLDEQLGVETDVLLQRRLQPGVGALQLGDGGGIRRGVFGLLDGDPAEDQYQRGVEDVQQPEGHPVHGTRRGQPPGLRAGHDHRGGQQPRAYEARRQQMRGVEVAEHRVDREEGVQPGQHEGQQIADEVVKRPGR